MEDKLRKIMDDSTDYQTGEVDSEIAIQKLLDLFNVSQQRKLLESFVDYAKDRSIRDINIDDDTILYFLEDSNCG